jgi:hypothetical protein
MTRGGSGSLSRLMREAWYCVWEEQGVLYHQISRKLHRVPPVGRLCG